MDERLKKILDQAHECLIRDEEKVKSGKPLFPPCPVCGADTEKGERCLCRYRPPYTAV